MMLSFKIFMPNTIQGKIFMLATKGLRLVRIVRYIKRVEESMKDNQTWKQVMIKLINQIMTMYLVAHVNACLNYLVSRQSENTQSWVYARGIQTSNQEIYTAYRWALFKSFSHMFCIGFGIVHPTTFHDALTTLFSMLSGSIMFVLFLGQMTSLFQSLNISKAQYKQKLQQVKEYMIFRKLPMELRYRMNDYYENRFQGKMFDEDKILSELNPVLREELVNHNCCELIESVPFFKNADADFLARIISVLKYEVYLNGDCIIKQGDLGNRMYFIARGQVLIRNTLDTEQIQNQRTSHGSAIGASSVEQRLADGCYFGEICLLAQNIRRVASVYADSSLVNAYALNRDDFENVLTGHPEMREHIQQVASARLDAIYNGNGDDARQSVKTALDEAISHYAKKDDWMDSDDEEVGDMSETASGESV